MPRKPLIRNTHYPYHLIARSNNKEWFYLPTSQIWDIFLEVLNRSPVKDFLKIHAFVLMSNHFHLMASSVDGNIDKVMHYLLREVCRKINFKAKRINHVFGGPYKWSLITTPTYYSLCLKYIFQNPVRAKICSQVEEYPYSTAQMLLNPEKLPLSIDHWSWSGDFVRWGCPESLLGWLNSDSPSGLMDYIKKGLRRREFEIPKTPSRRKVSLEYLNHPHSILLSLGHHHQK